VKADEGIPQQLACPYMQVVDPVQGLLKPGCDAGHPGMVAPSEASLGPLGASDAASLWPP
jgi:hypothetical protein